MRRRPLGIFPACVRHYQRSRVAKPIPRCHGRQQAMTPALAMVTAKIPVFFTKGTRKTQVHLLLEMTLISWGVSMQSPERTHQQLSPMLSKKLWFSHLWLRNPGWWTQTGHQLVADRVVGGIGMSKAAAVPRGARPRASEGATW